MVEDAAPALLALGIGLIIGCLVAYTLGKFSREQARAPIEQAAGGDMALVTKFEEVLQTVDKIAA